MSEKSKSQDIRRQGEKSDTLETQYKTVGISAVTAAAPYCRPAGQDSQR